MSMKNSYNIPGVRASADLMHIGFNNAWLLTRLETGREIRGEGYASKLLDLVLEDADKNQATIVLSVAPDGTGLNEDQLRAFYRRRDFVSVWKLGESAMIRRPQTNNSKPKSLGPGDVTINRINPDKITTEHHWVEALWDDLLGVKHPLLDSKSIKK